MSLSVNTYSYSKKLTYAQLQDELTKADFSNLPKMRILVMRNIIIEPIVPYLRYHAYEMGYSAEIDFGEYNNVIQESLGSNPELFVNGIDCIFIFLYLETLSRKLIRNFSALSTSEITKEVNAIQENIRILLAGIRQQTDCMILWHAFEWPVNPVMGILDSQSETGQKAVIEDVNKFLLRTLKQEKNAFLVDLNQCIARVGAKSFYDWRYWYIGKAPYSREGLKEIAYEDFKYIRPLKGKNKKCIVLDCDNTLWGGVIGEDGLAGIKLSKNYPGSEYYEFQQEVLNLYNKGILIALCSKNNENDIWEVFEKHPDMLLKKDHISTAQINWQDKATNLKQIARDLNIGLDSIVFVDDNEFEVNLVSATLPEVDIILLPKDREVEYRQILASCGLFDNLVLSEEDRKRGSMYADEKKREALKNGATNLKEYYESLDMVVKIRPADDFSLSRIAQLTQKTNQFNLTTRRYSDADIKRFMTSSEHEVIYLELNDIFGESGIVGVCILRYEKRKAFIDTLLISCRVLGRGVEDVFLYEIISLLQKRCITSVIGEFYPTQKNSQVELFYTKHGFKELEVPDLADLEGGKKFICDPTKINWSKPEYFKEIQSHCN